MECNSEGNLVANIMNNLDSGSSMTILTLVSCKDLPE